VPYDFFGKLGTFETGKSNIDSCLFMMQDTESYSYLSTLLWLSEARNREDLVKSGFKVKLLSTPSWILKKCGKDIFKDYP
jgi:hypothetical protein